MRYSYEYKRNCIELYRQGKWPETPKGIKERNFRIMIGRWARIEKYQGPEALRHKNFNKIWTPEEKLELISQVLAGKSNQEVALSAGINGGMLYQWVQKYKSKCITVMKKIINLLKNSRMQLKNIFTTTTTKEFRKKQNGCHL